MKLPYFKIKEAFEEAKDSLDEIHEQYFKALKLRTIGAVAFSLPLVIIAMVPSFMNLPFAIYSLLDKYNNKVFS